MDNGKSLYVEGCDFGYANDTTQLFSYLGASYLGDGNDSIPGNVSTVNGVVGTITENMAFGYLYQQGPDRFVDVIGASGGTVVFRSQDAQNRVIAYSGASGSYHTVYSTFIFGALRDGTCSKDSLMARYLNYLLN